MSDPEHRAELRRFLMDRRARISPAEAGLPATGRRRVRGLRREEVATLAGIGLTWYTALENGDAEGVSEATLLAVSDALDLSESERRYLLVLAGRVESPYRAIPPDPLAVATMHAIAFPAYIITAEWEAIACNGAFRRVWAIGEHEVPFNTIERLFIDPAARAMHGAQFFANVAPVIAMLRSGIGRRPESAELRRLRDILMRDEAIRPIWDAYAIASPLESTRITIASPIGTFTYETLTLPIAATLNGIVVQVPDAASRALFDP